MPNKIVNQIKKNKSIISNMSYLTLLQLINILIPLLTYPYIIRVLGVLNYGLIVYSQAIIGYLVLIISFGFNIVGTKEISINILNTRKLSKIVSSILVIKAFIFMAVFFLLLIGISFIEIENKLRYLIIATMWMGLYEVFFPVFYFQGTEKMKYITILNFISKIIFLLLVFLFIKDEANLLLYPFFNGITSLLVCIISFSILKREGIVLYFPNYYILKYYIKRSYVMALAYMSNNLKSGLNIIIIKVFFGIKEVAYFDLAMKVVNLGNVFSDVVSQAIFPKIAREKNMFFLKKVLRLVILLTLLFVVGIYLFGDFIIGVLGGVNMEPAILILKIISVIVPIYAIGGLLGRNCLIVFGKDKAVLNSMVYSGGVYLMLVLIYYLLAINSLIIFSTLFVVSFAVETILRYLSCKKERLI